MDVTVTYSQPGDGPTPSADSASGLTPANPIARLFARIINGALTFTVSLLFWLAALIAITLLVAGDLLRYLWPLIAKLDSDELSNADQIIADAISEYYASYSVGSATTDIALATLLPLAAALLAYLLRISYLCLMVRFAGGDIGHLALGLRVVNYRNGARPTFGQALGRALLKQLDSLFFPWLINGLMALFSPERRHLYDLAADTMVVPAAKIPSPAPQTYPSTSATDAPQLTGNRPLPLPPPRA